MLAIFMLADEKSPRKISKEQIEKFAAESREPRSFLFAAELLAEKRLLRTSQSIMNALGLQRKSRETKEGSYGSIYIKPAKYILKLTQSQRWRARTREKVLDHVCKRFETGYASLDYNSQKAQAIRKRYGAGIENILGNKIGHYLENK
ncbi:MAG: hypothetical protein ACRD5H_15425 [Nitrososphaerales archaeon]